MKKIIAIIVLEMCCYSIIAQDAKTDSNFASKIEELSYKREIDQIALLAKLEKHYYSISPLTDSIAKIQWARMNLLMDMKKYADLCALYQQQLLIGKKIDRIFFMDSIYKTQNIQLPKWYDEVMLERVKEVKEIYNSTKGKP